ncbi:MAG: hypothetical protein ACP5E4_01790 [Candidatus Aenigmatarchaeota archaeon]
MGNSPIAQYDDNPSVYYPEPPSPQQGGNPNKPARYAQPFLYVAIGLVLLVAVYLIFFNSSDTHEMEYHYPDGNCDYGENCLEHPADCPCAEGYICSPQNIKANTIGCVKAGFGQTGNGSIDGKYGNGICDPNENCWDCPKDCKCSADEYCSKEERACLKPECGNGICETYESPESCCLDCECLSPSLFCNETSKSCQSRSMSLSCERALELVRQYYESQGEVVNEANCMDVMDYGGELVQVVEVNVEGESVEGTIVYRQAGVRADESVFELPTF